MIETSSIVVLDFDNTITHEHTHGCAKQNQITEDYITLNTKQDFPKFIDMLASQKIPFYIATYGDDSFKQTHDETAGYTLIKTYINRLLGLNSPHFTFPDLTDGEPMTRGNVIASFSLDQKQYHLDYIMKWEQLSEVDLHRILLIDDDVENIEHWLNKGCRITHDTCLESAIFANSETVFSELLTHLE